MTELEHKEAANQKRLVLSFDAGCLTCSELARQIKEQVDNKLEIRSLRDPQVQEWRRRALGEEATWVPTFIEVNGFKVRAWTGKRMGIHLSRSLGPVATWRVMQVLGELGAAAAKERLEGWPVGALVEGMSRAQFFKVLSGAVVAMSVLSGTGSFASTAFAAQKKRHKSTGFTEIKGEQLTQTVRGLVVRPDIRNVASGKDLASIAQYDDAKAKKGHTDPLAWGAMHKLQNGNNMLAIGLALAEGRVLIFYNYDKSVSKITTGAVMRTLNAKKERWQRTKSSHNGRLDKWVNAAKAQDEVHADAASPADPCGGCCAYYANGHYYGYTAFYPGNPGDTFNNCVTDNLSNCTYCQYLSNALPSYGPEAAFACLYAFCPSIVTVTCGESSSAPYQYCYYCTECGPPSN